MNNSLAVGKNSYADAGYYFGAVAAGINAKAFYGVAIGYGATAGRFYKYIQGDGIQSKYSAEGVAIGNKSTALGGVAVGPRATSGGLYGTAIGNLASVGYSGVALGTKASVTVDTGVALGVEAVANRAMGTYGYIPFADDTNASLIPTNDSELASAIGASDSVKNFYTTYATEIAEYSGLNRAYAEASKNADAQRDIILATKGSADPAEQQQYIDAENAERQYDDEASAITQQRNEWLAAHPEFAKAVNEHSQALLTYKSTEGAVSVGVSGSQTRQIINVAAGTEDTDAVNVAQLKRVADEIGKKANLDASNLTDGDVTAWQQKLGNGTVTEGNTGLVTGGTVYTALEGKADTNLSNITAEGETVISNIAKDSVVVKAGANVTVDDVTVGNTKTYTVNVSNDAIKGAVQADLDKKADATYVDSELDKKADKDAGNLTADDVAKWQEKLGNGKNEAGNTGLITGDTLNKALAEIDISGQITNKADTDLGNITKEGETVIANIAKDSVKVIDGTNTTVTVGADGDATTYAVNVSNDAIKNAVKDDLDKKADTDAGNLTDGDVTKWQEKLGVHDLTEQFNGLDSRVNQLDGRIDRVGAGAAALAALHPLDFDPEDKWTFAAGVGHYRSTQALAIGAFYRPNAKTMFSVAGSIGNGDDMLNLGVSFKLGDDRPYSGYSRAALTTVIEEQQATIGALEDRIAGQQQQIEEILQQLAELKK